MLEYLTDDVFTISKINQQLKKALYKRDFSEIEAVFKQFFAGMPYHWYTNTKVANYESYYAMAVYCIFNGIGIEARPEDTTNVGRIDLMIRHPEYFILLEFKLNTNGDAKSAIQQIKDKNYAAKYEAENKPIYFIGMSFDSKLRNISDFAVELKQ